MVKGADGAGPVSAETAGAGRLARGMLGWALGVFLLDQATKVWVIHALALPSVGRIEVAPPYLTFVMAWNRGVNFGIGSAADLRWVLVGVAVAISVALFAWVVARRKAAIVLGAGLVIGGALGNAVDRVLYGAVADFLNMSCCGIHNPYAFNVADIAIFAGAVWIAIRA